MINTLTASYLKTYWLIDIMNDQFYVIFGYAASVNACIMMIPQVYVTFKNKSIKDLSIAYIIMNLCTQLLFFPYSIHFKLYPLITVNSFLSIYDICIIIMYYNIEYKNETKYAPLLSEP